MKSFRKILLIGGAGFLGNSLAKHFSDLRIPVVVADSRRRLDTYATFQPHAEYVEIEWPVFSKGIDLTGVTDVIHLAWTSNPSWSMECVAVDAKENIMTTLRLLEEVSQSDIKNFMFMSSGGTVYGNSSSEKPTEECSTTPISAYGISKLACENYVSLFARQYSFTPLIVRLGNPYGAYQLAGTPVGVIANFVNRVMESKPINIYGSGQTVRDYIHIDDVLTSVELLLKCDDAYGTYNLGSGQGVSIAEIISILDSVTDKKIIKNMLEERRSDVRSIVLNVDKLSQTINYEPRVSIEKGIKDMVDAHKGHTGSTLATVHKLAI